MSGEIGVEIVTRVAASEGTDPMELTPSLGEVIDVDALEAVLQSSPNGTSVEFEYRDWTVETRGDRTIMPRGLADAD